MAKLIRTPVPGLVAAAAAVLAAGALAGCGNGLSSSTPDAQSSGVVGARSPSPSDRASSSPSASPSRGTSGGSAAGSSSATSTPSARGPQPCAAGQLSLALDRPSGGGAAGSVYLVLTFTNKSSTACTMSGHPGVSFVGGGDGTQLGTSADREGKIRTVMLPPGEATHAMLEVADAGDYDADDCLPVSSDGLRVYPPDSRASVYLPYRTRACRGELGRGHSQLQVFAVGQSD